MWVGWSFPGYTVVALCAMDIISFIIEKLETHCLAQKVQRVSMGIDWLFCFDNIPSSQIPTFYLSNRILADHIFTTGFPNTTGLQSKSMSGLWFSFNKAILDSTNKYVRRDALPLCFCHWISRSPYQLLDENTGKAGLMFLRHFYLTSSYHKIDLDAECQFVRVKNPNVW